MSLIKINLLSLTILVSTFSFAERTAYVTDNLSTAVRSGATNEYRIIYYLPAGTSVTVLDDEPENGFIKVRDDKGREGWTLERFITDQKGARIKLVETQDQLSKALLTIENQKKQHSAEMAKLQQQLDSASNLIEKNQSLQQEISELQTKNSTLEQQNRRMNDRYLQEWFFAGGLTVVVGVVIGVIFGRISRKKRSAWN
ncbi:TIGR04211 family SH3 domain-containing protein [Pleionea sediminis]|uniref:TIGR04211 family SH3 domain-containing protein n=1 Tax=Pleionea sediminis TaxID=2569479 RepID=UPI0013DE75A6|nr:TIGR04211 family SH3 domain-containing protein [Pleionea sediminis]